MKILPPPAQPGPQRLIVRHRTRHAPFAADGDCAKLGKQRHRLVPCSSAPGFPTRDIGTDPAKIRDWAQAAEDLGYAHIEVPDHVFGATARENFKPTYDENDPFHETFTTLAFMAAVTKRIGLTSGVLILPQRQTGVVAKQAAEVDLLSGGGCGSASAWAGTTSNTRRSTPTGTRAAPTRPSRSLCCAGSGPRIS